MEELQREYDSIRLWGPALGVPVSYFTVGGGLSMIVAANLDFCFYSPCADEPRTPSDRALLASGSIFIAAGVAGFVASIVRIAQRESESAGCAMKWATSASAASEQLFSCARRPRSRFLDTRRR